MHHDVKATVGLQGLPHHRVDGIHRANIDGDQGGVAAGRPDLRHSGLPVFRRARRHHHLGAFSGEQRGDGGAYALARTRHNGDLATQPVVSHQRRSPSCIMAFATATMRAV